MERAVHTHFDSTPIASFSAANYCRPQNFRNRPT